MKLATGLVIAGRYRLEKRLAIGGMGSLWVARHAQLDVEVAIKFIDPKQAGSAVARQRFELEARASATLRNAHVVHVQDYGIDGDLPYLVMELLHGEDLGRRLDREKRLPLPTIARILRQTAKGLRRAHEAGVVHRDLKPANLFLARADEEEETVKILDFGIAKETGAILVGEGTKTGELMGSPHYMSPEQVRGAKDLDHRSDLWSLGVILFRATTGKLPFASQVLGAVIAHILADPIPRPTEIAPDLPHALDAFFARAFSRDKTQRFQSAREMSDAFTLIAHGSAAGPSPRFDSLYDGTPSSPNFTPTPLSTSAPVALLPTPPSTPQPALPPSATPPSLAKPVAPSPPRAPPPRPSGALLAPSVDVSLDPFIDPLPSSAPSFTPADGVSPSGNLTATGGPLVRTTPIPNWGPRSPSAATWGVGVSVALGVGFVALFLAMKGGGSSSASEEASASHASSIVRMTAALPHVKAPPVPSASAPASSEREPPKVTSPPPKGPETNTKRKKPSWGF